jgi:hypothetical protein
MVDLRSLPPRLRNFPSLLGVPVDSLSLIDDDVPGFLPVACSFIALHRNTVGIFRLCGDHVFIQVLGVVLNFPRLSIPPSGSVHDVAAFLKLSARSLPVPLITPAVANEH